MCKELQSRSDIVRYRTLHRAVVTFEPAHCEVPRTPGLGIGIGAPRETVTLLARFALHRSMHYV